MEGDWLEVVIEAGRLVEAKIDPKEMLEWNIESTDGEIDRLVHELYDLTEEALRIVVGGVGKI